MTEPLVRRRGRFFIYFAALLSLETGLVWAGSNTATAQADPQLLDLEITKTVDDPTPAEGERIIYTVVLANNGVDNATGIEVTDQLPAGVTYQSDTTTQGTYTSGTGIWDVGSLAGGATDSLTIVADVDAGTGGSTIVNMAAITAVDQFDADPGNDTDWVSITVQTAPDTVIVVTAGSQDNHALVPGAVPEEVFRVGLRNTTTQATTLTAIAFENAAEGPASQVELDGNWGPLTLITEGGRQIVGTSGFTGGTALFSGLSVPVPAGEEVTLIVTGGASLNARDGDELDLKIGRATDLQFSTQVNPEASWPLDPPGSFPVNGMAAAQITLYDVETTSFPTGSVRNLVLDLVVPANGYEDDVLERLNVVNLGTALAGADILTMEGWADDGDGVFDPDADPWLGEMSFTGNRWELTGLAEPVSVGGVRVFVSCDLAELATQGHTIQFSLPAAPEDAIGMLSGNDGPVDQPVANQFAQSISVADRVVLSASPVGAASASPGDEGVLLLHLVATNTYTVEKTLETLALTNMTSGGGSATELDAEVKLLSLRADGDGNGDLGDLTDDPLIGTAFFIDGEATFTGLSWTLAAAESGHLFVTGEIALLAAADGDVVGVEVPGAESLSFADGTSVVASWPVDSGARWTIDGMVAEQISNVGAPVATLGPNEGPALALDLLVPRNGYATDLLQGIRLENQGTAATGDLAEVHLWQDGGDGGFDAGTGDDIDLGPMSGSQGEWSTLLSLPLVQVGTRLFVSVVASATPTDSATVQLAVPAVPVGGITVDSGNDGPIDIAVANSNQLLLSTAALLTTLELDPSASILGQTVTASLTVRNVSGIQITNITPSPLTPMGDGTLQLLTGPLPATLTLDPAAEDTFVWTYEAMSAGEVRLSGSASGIEFGSGQPRQSLASESNTHRVFLEAQDISLFPVESMPFAINRGQTDVVPISLTFTNEGGAEASDVEILGLRIRVEEESGGGIVPADVLSRVVVNEGTNVYLEKTSLETAGSIVELPLIQPIIVEAGAEASSQVTVSLSLDISSTTTVPNFRLTMADSTWVTASDATSGGPVTVLLQVGAYPIASGLARIVTEATELVVDGSPAGARTAGRGQSEVELLTLDLFNPDPAGLASDVRVISFGAKLVDSLGAVVARPSDYLERIRVRDPLQQYDNRAVGDDSTLTLSLTPLLSVPVNTPLALTLTGDISSTAELGSFRLRLADAGMFDARDANSGDPVVVTYAPDPAPVEGGLVTVEAVAETLLALGTAHLPPVLTVGTVGIDAMEVALTHPGGPGTARIRCESLAFRVVDQASGPLIPASYLDRVEVLRDQTVVGLVTDLAPSGNTVTVPISGCLLDPGDTATLLLRIAVEATAPTTFFEMTLAEADIQAVDQNLGAPVTVTASGGAVPFTTGLTQLQVPPSTLAVGFTDSMPPVLAPDGLPVTVASLTLTNTASSASGAIEVDRLELRAADHGFTELVAGAALSSVEAYVGGLLWAESGPLAAADQTALLSAAEPLTVGPETPVEVKLELRLREGSGMESLRIGFDEDGIGVVQPPSALLTIAVQAAEGETFPMWTAVGNLTGPTLANSYSNFPNPFAAGRQQTRFAFYLPAGGRVSLDVLTIRGETVRTVIAGAPFPAGLHQGEIWDGRNGRGDVVVNGVYLAEIRVAFDDGSSERFLRKVAVIR